MSVLKDYRFSVTSTWLEDRRGTVAGRGTPDLDVAIPREFHGEHPDLWSPEELLLAACASSYELTLAAAAEHHELPLESIEISAVGHVTRRIDGRLGCVAIELDVRLATEPDRIAEAEELARRTKDACVVPLALATPLTLRVTVTALVPERTAAR
jgi:organic hydroperoxide reductase OsmC/OhrA